MRAFLGALLLALALASLPAVAAAGASAPAAGTFAVTDFALTAPPEQHGHACVLAAEAVFHFTGDLSGAAPLRFQLRQNRPCDQTGAESFTASGVFSGTIDGATGTLEVGFQGHIDAAGHARGELSVLDGAGGLQHLHGHLTLTGQAGVGGTYAGRLTAGQ